MKDGTKKRYNLTGPVHKYVCPRQKNFPEEAHGQHVRYGPSLDWQVWTEITNKVILDPALILEQIYNRQEELQEQGDNFDSDIAKAERELNRLKNEKLFYLRQAAKGLISKSELESLIEEIKQAQAYWQEELSQLKTLRDDSQKTEAGVEYIKRLFDGFTEILPEINQPPEELRSVPIEKRNWVLLRRQEIIRALADKIVIHSDGTIDVEGIVDGSEVSSIDSPSIQSGLSQHSKLKRVSLETKLW